MIKNSFKEDKGITLITLMLAIVIMLIISSIILYNAKSGIDTRNLNNMYNDIQILKDRVDIYYSKHNELPILEEAYNTKNKIPNGISNPNDNSTYYVVNLELLDNLTLTYGQGYYSYKTNTYIIDSGDIYIINEKSHNIYYVRGISLDGKTYYTKPGTYTKVEESTINCNHPILGGGMTPIKWNGVNTIETKSYDQDWYDYKDTLVTGQAKSSRWANAKTKDGSMWVWIPRFAYKITYTNSDDKSLGGTIDIVFLKGTTNKDFNGNDVTNSTYVDEKGATGAYIVHPAFQDGSNNGFANGEWDEEIEGFWMAKFEAGYVGEVNKPETAVDSNVTYSTMYSWPDNSNYTESYYGTRDLTTKIKYPTFQPNRPSMNYIPIADAYDLSMDIKNATSVYGLSNIDSHLTKNSEWGAVAYLSYSKYGTNGREIVPNNISLNGTMKTIYAVTGYGAEAVDSTELRTTWDKILDETSTGQAGKWTTSQGQKASTTGNIYGIYDLSGGLWEWTAGYVATDGNYQTYGGNIKGESNKYKSKYAGISATATENYDENINKLRLGEAIWETSSTGTDRNSWNNDASYFTSSTYAFFSRGGCFLDHKYTGLFNYSESDGICRSVLGFRPVLINTVK